eukprot:CAMPEP_0206581740 /NCGR_PEP_ID=MMETSP0325_2-20121206/34029_1 /ASSEMBLY_ACC=CAM_ASM_000347 /TAXON_ID=2866 /ORGANISM="Crypthecodinium cohnii, Strain Seligo" /LENGTH=121 /DNA_ID=CAMNT_0054088209 /DNA_START=421 /DNA_END=786 /DNA_ORIENTATION=+
MVHDARRSILQPFLVRSEYHHQGVKDEVPETQRSNDIMQKGPVPINNIRAKTFLEQQSIDSNTSTSDGIQDTDQFLGNGSLETNSSKYNVQQSPWKNGQHGCNVGTRMHLVSETMENRISD